MLRYHLLASFILGRYLLGELSRLEVSADIESLIVLISLHAQTFYHVQFVCEVCLFDILPAIAAGVLVRSERRLLAYLTQGEALRSLIPVD